MVKAKSNFIITNPDDNIRADMAVGSISAGEVVTGGSTLEQFVEQLITTIFEPSFVAPSISVSTSLASVVEAGTTGITFKGNFNRGSIVGALVNDIWTISAAQDFRSGTVATYVLSAGDQRANNSGVFPNTIIQAGTNTFKVSADYLQGPQPLNNRNKNFSTPLPAGSLATTATITGARRAFYGLNSAASTSSQIRSLSSVLNPNNGTSFVINIPIGATSVIFAYPSTLRDVTSVKYAQGSDADVKGAFGLPSTVSVEGLSGYAGIDYKVYRYQPVEAFPAAATYTVTI
jgi:hypothetical protein